jgi:DUF1680 family protein
MEDEMKIEKAMPVDSGDVLIKGSFWSEQQENVRTKIIPYQWAALNDEVQGAEPSHAVANFKRAAGMEQGPFGGYVFQDSDLAKWLEAVAYSLGSHPDPDLEEKADQVIEIIRKAQQADGYLDTAFILKDQDKRWTNLLEWHELYCAGHMMEAATAYYQATGKDVLLKVMERVAEHIDQVFGEKEGLLKGVPGHEEVELALVKMYRATGKVRYLEMARRFIDRRGTDPNYFDVEADKRQPGSTAASFSVWWKDYVYEYNQSHLPVRKQEVAVGHAVRAMYLFTGMADVALETGDETLAQACETLFENVTRRQMYITGGVGSSDWAESFTFDYDLPNDTCYNETCASIGLVFWAYRMLRIRRDGRYADTIEQALYNGVLSGVSLDGHRFFYVNPLEVWPESAQKRHDKGHVKTERQKWFGCACCPPNLSRLIASLGGYILTTDDAGIQVHLYVDSEAKVELHGKKAKVVLKTEYPWSGSIRVRIENETPAELDLSLRIPGWCRSFRIQVNGVQADPAVKDGYAVVRRVWLPTDELTLELDMPAVRMKANPRLRYDAGRVALMRGPVVYCLEEADNGDVLTGLRLPPDSQLDERTGDGIFEGIPLIEADGMRDGTWAADLYRPSGDEPAPIPVRLHAVPYFMWNNRGQGEMIVWIRE